MITFKTFLVEASTGATKWEKYFSSGDVKTITKNDAQVFDLGGNLKDEVLKGTEVLVLAAPEYQSKVQVRLGKKVYLMKFADIDKPFKLEQAVGIQLKPDQLGILGAKFISGYSKEVKKLIKKNSEIPAEYAEYLCALVDLAEKPENSELVSKVQDLYLTSGVSEDQSFKNTVNNDFMEILGPFFVIAEKPEYKEGGVKFPELGNEPKYDFTMKAKRGANEKIDSFSSKRSGGSSNTLKVKEILDAAESSNPAIKRKYSKEIQVLKIILANSVKTAPHELNKFLKDNFRTYKIAKEPKDNTEIARLEAAVAKWINEESGMNFVPLIQLAIPDLWYVKSRLATDGTFKVEPLKSGREISKAVLRSKSSPNHLADKLGFAV